MDEYAWMRRQGTVIETVEPRSRWRGVTYDSWWLVLCSDDEHVTALCLKAPDGGSRKVQPGEIEWLRRDTFGWFFEPL